MLQLHLSNQQLYCKLCCVLYQRFCGIFHYLHASLHSRNNTITLLMITDFPSFRYPGWIVNEIVYSAHIHRICTRCCLSIIFWFGYSTGSCRIQGEKKTEIVILDNIWFPSSCKSNKPSCRRWNRNVMGKLGQHKCCWCPDVWRHKATRNHGFDYAEKTCPWHPG